MSSRFTKDPEPWMRAIDTRVYQNINELCPWKNKTFSNQDIIDFLMKRGPSFNDEYWDDEYFLLLNNIVDNFFDNLFICPLNEAVIRLEDYLATSPNNRIVHAHALELLFRKLDSIKWLQVNDYKTANLYFNIPAWTIQTRIETLIEVVKSSMQQVSSRPTTNSIDQLFEQLNLPTSQKQILVKDLLMWARMPIFIWGLKFNKAFERIDYFKLLGKLHRLDVSDGADSNISDAVKEGTYHGRILELIDFLNKYANSYNEYHNKKSTGKKKVKDQLLIKLKNFGLS